MKGWHYESDRHALAARGVHTVKRGVGRPRNPTRYLTVQFWNGLVENVDDLPPGWFYKVFDLDSTDDTEAELRAYKRYHSPKTIKILVRGGILWEIKDLPKGYDAIEHHTDE